MIDTLHDWFGVSSTPEIIFWITIGVFVFGALHNAVYLAQIPLAALELLRYRLFQSEEQTRLITGTRIAPKISILVPAYNEAVTICDTVHATLTSSYPEFELIVVNDGSKDDTLQVLIERYGLVRSTRVHESRLKHAPIRGIYSSPNFQNLLVVDKENGGRADALNVGIDLSRGALFCTLDADSILDSTALSKAVQPFVERPDRVVATGGTIRILNGAEVRSGMIRALRLSRNPLVLIQVIEYMRAFLMGRLAWSRLGILTIISGAFAVFRRDIALEVGGFTRETIGEDFELVMKFHRYCLERKQSYEMRFVPEPVCWTEVPETLPVLRSQRVRWQQGALEVFFRHRDMFFNPRYGRIGMLAYPLIFIIDVVGPLVELFSYVTLPVFYALGYLDVAAFWVFIGLFFVMGIAISVSALVLEELSLARFSSARELLIIGTVAVLENLGYRQISNIWRITGWWRFVRKRQIWGDMQRVSTARN